MIGELWIVVSYLIFCSNVIGGPAVRPATLAEGGYPAGSTPVKE